MSNKSNQHLHLRRQRRIGIVLSIIGIGAMLLFTFIPFLNALG